MTLQHTARAERAFELCQVGVFVLCHKGAVVLFLCAPQGGRWLPRLLRKRGGSARIWFLRHALGIVAPSGAERATEHANEAVQSETDTDADQGH